MAPKPAFIVPKSGEWTEQFQPPQLTVLNFSGGKQSSALLWMVLLDEIQVDGPLIVLNADPGMENTHTYEYAELMRKECLRKGVTFIRADGPNLYEDLINLKQSGNTRLDLPGYYTKSAEGKKGKLLQGCTAHYKIAPMDRAMRTYMRSSKMRLQEASVHKWIGFSANEVHRIKPPSQRYVAFRYPLVEMGMSNQDVENWLKDNGLPIPPRSVCNACFANSAGFMAKMKRERPSDFQMALNVDYAVRDLKQIGVRDEVYVLSDLVPIDVAVKKAEESDSISEDICESGYCFT